MGRAVMTLVGAVVLSATFLCGPAGVMAAPKSELWAYWESHDPESTATVDHAPWNVFLESYVETTHPSGINRVWYGTVSQDSRWRLEEYLSTMQKVKVTSLRREEQRAYWINLYNALTVKVILDHYPLKSIRDIDISPGLFADGPWGAKLMKIEGKEVSLNDVEHRILRPIWKDARIHYAVNCASLGCPNLQPGAYTAANAESLLDRGAREYVNHERGVKIEGKTLTVSSIYDWFKSDFGGTREELVRHLLKYAEIPLAENLKAFDGKMKDGYDWSLNE